MPWCNSNAKRQTSSGSTWRCFYQLKWILLSRLMLGGHRRRWETDSSLEKAKIWLVVKQATRTLTIPDFRPLSTCSPTPGQPYSVVRAYCCTKTSSVPPSAPDFSSPRARKPRIGSSLWPYRFNTRSVHPDLERWPDQCNCPAWGGPSPEDLSGLSRTNRKLRLHWRKS